MNDMHNLTVLSLFKRAELFLEEKKWKDAFDYYESILDIDPECPKAYIGLLLASLKCSTLEELIECETDFENNKYYLRALQFSKEDEAENIKLYNTKNIYYRAQKLIDTELTWENLNNAAELFKRIIDYKDAKERYIYCLYEKALVMLESNNEDQVTKAEQIFKQLNGYKDSINYIQQCENKIEEIKTEKFRNVKTRNRKVIICTILVITLLSAWIIIRTNSNNALKKEIVQNFIGESFHYTELAGSDGIIGVMMDIDHSYTFENSENVQLKDTFSTRWSDLAKVYGEENETTVSYYDYDWKVTVGLFGKVTVYIGNTAFDVELEGKKPVSITSRGITYR